MTWTIGNNLLFLLVFLSGFAALIYQLIWTRLLGLVFGVSSLAVATVVGVFLLGLGLGSYFVGKWSEKSENPLKLYMLIEVAIAGLSIFSYVVVSFLDIYQYIYELSYNSFDLYGISIIRLLLSILILLPPVFAIGGTLPLLSKYFLTVPETLGSNFSRIYFLNTVGAFTGALSTGFFLVKYLGVLQTFMIAVGVNLLIAGLILLFKNMTSPRKTSPGKSLPATYMLAVLFLTGFISLSYEILWVRILSTYDLSTSQSFAVIVSGFLLGFSVGSWILSRRIDDIQNHRHVFGAFCILTALSGACVLWLFRRFDDISLAFGNILNADLFSVSLGLAFLTSFIPAVCMGVLFPLGLRVYIDTVDAVGFKAGKVFFANTLGCVAGSLFTGFCFIPFLGMWNTTLILINLSLILGLVLVLGKQKIGYRYVVSFLLVFVLANALVFTDQKSFHKDIEGFDVIYYEEGLSGTVSAIERKGYRGLFVDGQNVSGTDFVLAADSKMLAHLPLLLVSEPDNALTVGYGTGATSYSMLLHGIDVDAVEIEQKVVDAGYLFEKVNNHSYRNPRLDIILDDARSYIDAGDIDYDAIVTDVTNLKYKRNPYLYTKEYFELMRDSLDEGGVAAAWLPVGGLSFQDLQILIGTFDHVFPHTTVWYFTQYPTHFIIVIGTPEKTRVNISKLKQGMEPVLKDLKSIKVDNVYEVASMLLLGEDDVDRLVAGAELHTDNHPVLEFSDMGMYMQIDVEPNLKALLDYQKEDLNQYFTGREQQLEKLDEYFEKYQSFYQNYIRRYEANMKRHDNG